MNTRAIFAFLAFCLPAAATWQVAHAQSADEPSVNTLQEVVVSATLLRDEPIQTVPGSITVLDAATLQAVRERSLWVRPTDTVRACADPDDDIFLECAQASQANYLVTGNTKDFPASWLETRIITPRFLLVSLRPDSGGRPAAGSRDRAG